MTDKEDTQTEVVDNALRDWRQGDVSMDPGLEFLHLADMSCPHSPASEQLITSYDGQVPAEGIVPVIDAVNGFVVLTQTCDIIRSSVNRPFVEVAPLVRLEVETVEKIRCLKFPAFAYIPEIAQLGLVADLDRVMTVEKAVLASWTRTPGLCTDTEIREFAKAIAGKRARFAFPDDFVQAMSRLRTRFSTKHNRRSTEGAHLRALREIRVRPYPSWNHHKVSLTFWFIKDRDPEDYHPQWPELAEKWKSLIDESTRFCIEELVPCFLEDITALDYVNSDQLDLDGLSVERVTR